jgi:hypothetical protein
LNVSELQEYLDDEHFRYFSEFCRYDMAVGGPDPHMACVGHMSRNEGWRERMWRAGCYIGVYNVPTAEVIWQNWSWRDVSARGWNTDDMGSWISENWQGLALRRERRAVRTPAKLARFFSSYAHWLSEVDDAAWLRKDRNAPESAYEDAWQDVQRVYGLGRYVALKILEFFERYCEAPIHLPDLRPKGGWSPRTALALLYPDHAEALLGDDSRYNCHIANECATHAQMRLLGEYDVVVSRYNLQVLLCDYKQSYVGRRQYPGRSQDSEMMYRQKVGGYFENDTDMWAARREIFPPDALGEVQGWQDVREELGDVLRDFGYTWSDTKFKYTETTDLRRPIPK